jgi:hypothetical protein
VNGLLPLLVPAPALAFKAVGGVFAPIEGAVAISFATVRFPDGTFMAPEEYIAADALLTRLAAPGAPADIWDPAVTAWRPASGVDLTRVHGVPLAPPKTAADSWQGMLVSQKDASGGPQLQPSSFHFPQYRLRGSFRAKRDSVEAFGLGPESSPIEFASAAAKARFGADLTPDIDGATRARVILRNSAAQPAGVLDIDASAGNTVITLENFDPFGGTLASVTLGADGTIRLKPQPGKKVVIDGDFEADGIRYLPSGGGAKQDLI